MLSTFIKLPFVLKNFVCLFLGGHLRYVLLYMRQVLLYMNVSVSLFRATQERQLLFAI